MDIHDPYVCIYDTGMHKVIEFAKTISSKTDQKTTEINKPRGKTCNYDDVDK